MREVSDFGAVRFCIHVLVLYEGVENFVSFVGMVV